MARQLLPCARSPIASYRRKVRLGHPTCFPRLSPPVLGHTLPNQFALQFGESRKDVKEEPRHRIGVLGVEVLGDGDKTNTERNQFLNAFDGGGNAPPPSVQLPDQHRIDAASASVFEQSVQFWPRYGCAAPAGVQILIGDRPT